MSAVHSKYLIGELLNRAGITLNGSHPWDLKVYNDSFFNAILSGGSLKAGETYVDRWWDCSSLDEFFNRILKISIHEYLPGRWRQAVEVLLHGLFNFQTFRMAERNVKKHYNLGNDLFLHMLDKRMVYTCAYWKKADTLDQAQEDKLNLICLKLNLKQGMHILDIGCGWGSFAKFAAEKYDVKVTGITLSEDQVKAGTKLCIGLPVEIKLQDYRNVSGKFDRIVSLGMFEHVGYKNYREYMRIVNSILMDDGLFLLHTIGSNTSGTWTDPWLDHYIFPGSMLPSIAQIGKSVEELFVMEDWHNFSADYDKTLMAWFHNFDDNWDAICDQYDERFYRMWKYYLLSCAGSFRARKNQLWQIVFSKNGVSGGYTSFR